MIDNFFFLAITVLVQSVAALAGPEAASQKNLPLSPYVPPSRALRRSDDTGVLKRQQQGNCQANYISCASQSAPEACCAAGTYCQRDGAGQIACCPSYNVCTGTIGGGSGSASTSSGGSMTSAPASGSTITSPPTSVGSGQSYQITAGATVPNNYYPFPIIATTYSNSAACLSAYTLCQQQSTSCYASLAGQNGVTISNILGGGGVTQAGASGLVQASASSICSTLSVTGCYNLQPSQCSQFGNAGGSNSVQLGRGPRETGHAGARYIAAFGMVGAVGLVV